MIEIDLSQDRKTTPTSKPSTSLVEVNNTRLSSAADSSTPLTVSKPRLSSAGQLKAPPKSKIDTSLGCKPASTPKPSTSLVNGNKPRSVSTAGSSKLSSRDDLGAGGMNLGVMRYTKKNEKELMEKFELKKKEQYSEFANDDSSDDESVKVTQPKLARTFSSQQKSMKSSTTRVENTPRADSRTNVVSTQKKTKQSGDWTRINRKPIEILNTQKRVSKQRGMPLGERDKRNLASICIPFPDWPYPGGCAGGCIDLYEEEEKSKKRKRAEIGFRHSDEDSDYENDGEDESDHSE